MRRPPRSALAALLVLIVPAAARGDSEPEPVVVSVESTLNTVLRQIRQLAFDGDPARPSSRKSTPPRPTISRSSSTSR